jgi:hypothetical protein
MYTINLVVGDPSYFEQPSKIEVEGELVVDVINSQESPWDEVRAEVEVTDGKLTLAPPAGAGAKICFVEISSYSGPAGAAPSVARAAPLVRSGLSMHKVRGRLVVSSGIAGRLSVIDSRGRTVARRFVQADAPVSVDKLVPGCYQVRVVASDGVVVSKRVVAVR